LKALTPLPLSELPEWSPWPARLLGLEPWSIPVRTTKKIEQEYDLDKYGSCLKFFQNSNRDDLTPESILNYQQGKDLTAPTCVSVGDELFTMPLGEALLHQDLLRLEALNDAMKKARVVVELGCGYGYNLWRLHQKFPDKLYVGGEYSKNAVKLASMLFKNNPTIKVQEFDFYTAHYGLLDSYKASGPMVIFTAHAIEQLPSAVHVIKTLMPFGKMIQDIVLFEPIHELYDRSLLGLLCRRYTEVNDYNRDLLTCLRRYSEIRIDDLQAHAFGLNPLHPTSTIRCTFK